MIFKEIELHNEVIFKINNLRFTGLVVEIKKNTFKVVRIISYSNTDDKKSFHCQYFNFMKKSGKEVRYRNKCANVISFSKSFEQKCKELSDFLETFN